MARQRVGIIGAGKIAESQYLPALRQLGYSDISVYDNDAKRQERFATHHHTGSLSLEALIEHSHILVIATPPSSHEALVMQCIREQKTIICEKPFVLSGLAAEQIVEKADRHSCDVYVAHIRRIFSGIRLAKGYLAQLPYGKLLKAEIYEGGIFHYKTASGYVVHDPYGGVLYDTGSHALDCLLYISGLEKETLQARVSHIKKDKTEPSHQWEGRFMLNGVDVHMHLSRYDALSNKMNLFFENGIVEVPLGMKAAIRIREGAESGLLKSEAGIINFYSEAFRLELYEILVNRNKEKFGAHNFVQLSHLLEQLNHYKA